MGSSFGEMNPWPKASKENSLPHPLHKSTPQKQHDIIWDLIATHRATAPLWYQNPIQTSSSKTW